MKEQNSKRGLALADGKMKYNTEIQVRWYHKRTAKIIMWAH